LHFFRFEFLVLVDEFLLAGVFVLLNLVTAFFLDLLDRLLVLQVHIVVLIPLLNELLPKHSFYLRVLALIGGLLCAYFRKIFFKLGAHLISQVRLLLQSARPLFIQHILSFFK